MVSDNCLTISEKIKNNFGFHLLFVFECIIFGSESMGTYEERMRAEG
jgi:hypothetical protein